MAAQKKAKGRQSPKPQGSGGKNGAVGCMYTVMTVFISLLLVAAVFAGAFYYVLHNNIQGLGEKFRPYLQKVPIVKLALPPLPKSVDPEDPKYLTQKELEEKYNELRALKSDLLEQVDELKKRISELEKERQDIENAKLEVKEAKKQNEALTEKIKAEQQNLDKQREEIAHMLAQGDTEGFKAYFKKIDKATAEKIYKEVVQQEAVDQKIKALAKTYEQMEPKNAASILTELGNNDMVLLLNIMDAMKSGIAAQIMENMDPVFAAELMQKLADKKLAETS